MRHFSDLFARLGAILLTCIGMATMSAGLPSKAVAESGQRYVGVILGSEHVGSQTMNNINPGLLLGRRWDAPWTGGEYHAEAGVFYNSYREVSPIALFGASLPIGSLGKGELRLGGSVGIAYYKELSGYLEEAYGLPNAGGFIPIAAATISWRQGNTDIRLTTVPADRDTKAIVNLSVAFTY